MTDTNLSLPTLESVSDALSTPQRTALTALIRGSNIKDAAQTAGVHRTTLHRWISSNPTFRAAYNAWQHECKESTKTKLLSVVQDALSTVISAIQKGNHSLAYRLLKDLGVLTKIDPGLTDPQLLQKEMQTDQIALTPPVDPASPDPTTPPNAT